MSLRKKQDLYQLRHGRILVCGSFGFNGTSDPINLKGDHFTVTRAGTGSFFIKIPHRFPGYISANATLQLAASTDRIPMFRFWNLSGTTPGYPTEVIFDVLNGAGAQVDVAADENNRFHFSLIYSNTSR